MTLDEAIKHAEEKAEEQRNKAEWVKPIDEKCLKCAEEHEQLAEWLKDYKRLLEKKKLLSEADYTELRDRFGTFVEYVVRDMVNGTGDRWKGNKQ